MRPSNYEKFPAVAILDHDEECWAGWDAIAGKLKNAVSDAGKNILVIECYPGILDEEILPEIQARLQPGLLIDTKTLMRSPDQIDTLVQRDLTEDPVFGRLTGLDINDFFDPEKLSQAALDVARQSDGLVVIYGIGATLVSDGNVLVYADMARWEAQMRFRRNAIGNLGTDNHELKWSLQYKRAFFIDWRVCDKLKKELIERWDYVLDTNTAGQPKMATGDAIRDGLRQVSLQPFRVVPFFDPAPWGGQWMKQVCDLDKEVANFGWCFDCVPEENSLLLKFGQVKFETPSINLVFYRPAELLGEAVYGRFGAEFPIRFDFLDTIGGGNLSFQVHPLTEYIQQHFGMHYTQDESYYILDATPDASVYLGLKNDVDREQMADDLHHAQSGDCPFPADKYVNTFPAKKHDHFLIPAGTPHCSGAGSMVLEISATPYIFTFKMWDWGRMGLDGRPRPVHLAHGLKNIKWERKTEWVRRELVNNITEVATGEGWTEQRTGLQDSEYIETRRHWFDKCVPHDTGGGVNVLNLVEGDEIIVESPTAAFDPFIIHYAETFVIPAAVGKYTIRPHGSSESKTCATMKAFVRTKA